MRFEGKEVSIKPGWTLVLKTNNTISVYDEHQNILRWSLMYTEYYSNIIKDEVSLINLTQIIAELHSWSFEQNKNFRVPAFTFTEK